MRKKSARANWTLTSVLLALLAAMSSIAASPADEAEASRGPISADERLYAIEVPIDRQDPTLGSALIHAELGASFDAGKPFLFVIGDAQQFHLRKNAVARLQEARFGSAFNVIGVIGRSQSPSFIEACLMPEGVPDWERSWAIFSADEWVEDIEAIRRALLGADQKIMLYGQSGGALLVHQYMARYGRHVTRAVSSAPLNPFLVGALGLRADRFWDEIGAQDVELQGQLLRVLRRHPEEREAILMTLQRQNFFVAWKDLPEARAKLIRALAAEDAEAYQKARSDYQVDIIRGLLASSRGIPVRVRHFEFVAPSGLLEEHTRGRVLPDTENQLSVAAPLLPLWKQGRIPTPTWDSSALHGLGAEVLIIAGARDHTVDYRSAIALAFSYPAGRLFLADDDHQFHRLKGAGVHDSLVRGFLDHGADSDEYRALEREAEPYRFRGF